MQIKRFICDFRRAIHQNLGIRSLGVLDPSGIGELRRLFRLAQQRDRPSFSYPPPGPCAAEKNTNKTFDLASEVRWEIGGHATRRPMRLCTAWKRYPRTVRNTGIMHVSFLLVSVECCMAYDIAKQNKHGLRISVRLLSR